MKRALPRSVGILRPVALSVDTWSYISFVACAVYISSAYSIILNIHAHILLRRAHFNRSGDFNAKLFQE